MAEEKRKLRKWIKKKLKKQKDMSNPHENDKASEIERHRSGKHSALKYAGIYLSADIYNKMDSHQMEIAISGYITDFELAVEYMRKINDEEDSKVIAGLVVEKNRKIHSAGIFDKAPVYGERQLERLEKYAKRFKKCLEYALYCQKEIEKLEPPIERVESPSKPEHKAATDAINCSCELCRKSSSVEGGTETESPPAKGPDFVIL